MVQADKNKVEELRGSPLSVGTLEEIIDDNHAIVSTPHGPEYYVGMCSFVDKDQVCCSNGLCDETNAVRFSDFFNLTPSSLRYASNPRCFQIEPGCTVLLHNKVMAVVGLLSDEVDPLVSVMKVDKAPLESYADIGGLEAQIQEVKVYCELID
jgi:26S proteasome regulatory subunit T2